MSDPEPLVYADNNDLSDINNVEKAVSNLPFRGAKRKEKHNGECRLLEQAYKFDRVWKVPGEVSVTAKYPLNWRRGKCVLAPADGFNDGDPILRMLYQNQGDKLPGGGRNPGSSNANFDVVMSGWRANLLGRANGPEFALAQTSEIERLHIESPKDYAMKFRRQGICFSVRSIFLDNNIRESGLDRPDGMIFEDGNDCVEITNTKIQGMGIALQAEACSGYRGHIRLENTFQAAKFSECEDMQISWVIDNTKDDLPTFDFGDCDPGHRIIMDGCIRRTAVLSVMTPYGRDIIARPGQTVQNGRASVYLSKNSNNRNDYASFRIEV